MASMEDDTTSWAEGLEAGAGRNSLLTLTRGLAIMELLGRAPDGDGVTHSAIAEQLHFQKSTLYRYLACLQTAGYVETVGDTFRYRLGPRVFTLASEALRQRDFPGAAKEFVEALAAATGETAHATVFDRGEAVTVVMADGSGPIGPRISVGSRRPAHLSASGKVFLAFLPPTTFRAYVQRPLTGATASSITTADRLAQEVAEVRSLGYAVDRAEYVQGICCLAAPVFDMHQRIVGSLSLSMATSTLSRSRITALSAPLLDVASRFSRFLGLERA
jgi:IclR family acetate operon transcriptional repressor